jgi:hypothetical protein
MPHCKQQLQARDREVAALQKELASVKGLLNKNQQRAAVLLERLSGAMLGRSHGGGLG